MSDFNKLNEIVNSWETISIDYFKHQIDTLCNFVRDDQWMEMLKFDMALNPKLAEDIVSIIEQITSIDMRAEKIDELIHSIRLKCIELMNESEVEDDLTIKLYKYRHAYSYYGLVEIMTEGSIITEKIFEIFKDKYGERYLEVLSIIDSNNPSELTNFSKKINVGIDFNQDFIKLYLVMKHWQDNQHLFHEETLFPKYINAKKSFEKMVRENYLHLNNIEGKSLIALYIIENLPLIDVNILSRFVIGGIEKQLSSIIGGKNLGLAILNANGCNIPETHAISVTSLVNNHYVDILKQLKDYSYAVRSSATVEDNSKNSFAGLFVTVLNVKKEELLGAINKVHDSLYSKRVSTYSEHFKTEKPYMAIVLQEFREPQFSGVWIGSTIDSGFLEWVEGNGEKLVSGKTRPNREEWPNDYNDSVLTVENSAIGNLCLDLQRKLNTVADFEWCILDNKLVWLQYRPVTKTINTKTLIEQKNTNNEFYGVASSSGFVKGRPIYIEDSSSEFLPGSILLADCTDPEWVPIMLNSSAIVTAEGGALSHAAIISREIGIPCVTGIGYDAMEIVKNSECVEVFGDIGKVKVLKN